jgi:hypothetical protein
MNRNLIMCVLVAIPVALGILPQTASSQHNSLSPRDNPLWITSGGEAKYRVGTIIKCGSSCIDPDTQACCTGGVLPT